MPEVRPRPGAPLSVEQWARWSVAEPLETAGLVPAEALTSGPGPVVVQ